MKCSLSGLEYKVSFLSGSVSAPHPIFSLSTKEVVAAFLPKFSALELSNEELHLFGCFLTSKLPLVSWDYPLLESDSLENWAGFWLKHVEKLAALLNRIEGKSLSYLAQFHVTLDVDGSSIRNLPEWIKAAHDIINERTMPITDEARKRNKEFRANLGENEYLSEHHCTEIIKKGLQGSLLTKKEEKLFPELLAKWAAQTGEFPHTKFQLPNGRKLSIYQHWINILTKAFQKDGLGLVDLLCEDVTPGDIEEILEHCVVNIPNDNSHAITFFRELGKLQSALEEFRPTGLSAKAIKKASSADLLSLLGGDEVSPLAQPANIVNNDPNAPKKADFPSLAAYLKAKKAYSQSAGSQNSSPAEVAESSNSIQFQL